MTQIWVSAEFAVTIKNLYKVFHNPSYEGQLPSRGQMLDEMLEFIKDKYLGPDGLALLDSDKELLKS